MATNNVKAPLFELRDISFPRTVIIIPAFNEERFIGSVVLQAREFGTVIVINDGSTDRTAQIAAKAGAIVLNHEKNLGKGAALYTGFRYAKTLPSDVIVTLDGDGQHNCSEISRMITPILNGETDIVVGSRFLGVKNHIPKWRVFGQHILTAITNLSSGSHLTDSQSGYRAFSWHAMEVLNFESEGFSIESEMQFLAQHQHLRMMEVPISCIYTEPPKRSPFRQALSVLNGILRLVGQNRPLIFFGGGGFLVLFFGLLWGIRVVDIFHRVKVLAVGYALISVLLTILGSLGIFTGIMLHSVRGLMLEIKNAFERSKRI